MTFCTGTLLLIQTSTLVNRSQSTVIKNEMPFVLGLPNQTSPVTIQEDANTTQHCTVVTPRSFQIPINSKRAYVGIQRKINRNNSLKTLRSIICYYICGLIRLKQATSVLLLKRNIPEQKFKTVILIDNMLCQNSSCKQS